MTNDEMMDKQINDIAELFKGMFTPEELKQMEENFNKIIEEGNASTTKSDE